MDCRGFIRSWWNSNSRGLNCNLWWVRVRDWGWTPTPAVYGQPLYNTNLVSSFGEKNGAMRSRCPMPTVVWSNWGNGCECGNWKIVFTWLASLPCVYVCVWACVCPWGVHGFCPVTPGQWHQHWLFLFRHFLDLTTILGEIMAASSWPSPRAWKPMSWSKCLWWNLFS